MSLPNKVICNGRKGASSLFWNQGHYQDVNNRKIREQQFLRAKCFTIQYHSYTAHISFTTISSYRHISDGYSGPESVRMTQTIPQQLITTDQ